MRSVLAAAFMLCAATAARADEPRLDGPVASGPFGMGGSDYYGDLNTRMPYTG